ncbi:MAG: hypothetical protein ACRECN_08970, partial [Methylocella sp.]
MSYAAAISTILIAGLFAAAATALIQRRFEIDFRRRHHDVGSVVFLQLGVVFAVLLAFVFNEAWGEYNEAAQAIDLEVSAMHGVAMIAATLEPAQANTILAAERAYLEAVADKEWPIMARHRTRDVETSHKLEVLFQDAANLQLSDPGEHAKKAEILSLLAQAHTHRETRIFQANSGIPVPLWCVLIAFTTILALFVSFSGIQHRTTAVAIAACFTAGIVSILVIARLLDYPFEGALALRPANFIEVIGKVSGLLSHVKVSE